MSTADSSVTPGATGASDDRLPKDVKQVAVVVVLGTIMAILDTTIVAVALATLARDFHTTITTIQWVTTGYLLALAVVIPLSGWAVHRFGAKPVYVISLALFITGSALCGLAWSASALVAFRVLQGLGGGMIMPVGQTMMARTAGPDKMNRVMALIGVPTLLGPILGPVLGGLIVSNVSWRWCCPSDSSPPAAATVPTGSTRSGSSCWHRGCPSWSTASPRSAATVGSPPGASSSAWWRRWC